MTNKRRKPLGAHAKLARHHAVKHAAHHHDHWHWSPQAWPRYVRARLHRRLFLWFGVTILATIVLVTLVALGVSRVTAPPWRGGGPWRFLIPMSFAWVLLWGISGRLARRLTRPLWELVEVARDLGEGKLQSRARLRRGTPGEIGLLAESINDMAAKIEKQMAEQRELLAAVSHELRTPLGRMRVLIEMGRERADAKPQLDELDREVQEIDGLVGELLASARLDFASARTSGLSAEEVLRRAVERAGLPAELVHIEFHGASGQFSGDPTLLARALANVIDNAKRHGGEVRAVRLIGRAGRLAFEVEDRGHGFTDEAMRDLFKPFSGSATSLGLGLALVRRIAEAHGGTAYAKNLSAGGAVVGFEVAA